MIITFVLNRNFQNLKLFPYFQLALENLRIKCVVITSTTTAQMSCLWKLPTCPKCDGVFHLRGNRSHKRQRKWLPGSETKVTEAQSSEPVEVFAEDSTNLCAIESQKARDGMWKRKAHLSRTMINTTSGVFALFSKGKEMDGIQLLTLGKGSSVSSWGSVRNPSASLLARKFEKSVSRRALLIWLLGSTHCLMIKCGLEY